MNVFKSTGIMKVVASVAMSVEFLHKTVKPLETTFGTHYNHEFDITGAAVSSIFFLEDSRVFN